MALPVIELYTESYTEDYPYTNVQPLPATVELQLGGSYVLVGAAGSSDNIPQLCSISAPDRLEFDITTLAMDVRVDVLSVDWTPPVDYFLIGKNRSFGIGTPDWAWDLRVRPDGTLQLSWSPDGTFGGALSAISTAAVGAADGTRKAVRAHWNPNNGSGGWTVTFYTSDTLAGTWTQLGSAVTGSGVTSMAITAANLEISTINDDTPGISYGTASGLVGRVYGAEWYHTTVRIASPDFTRLAPGTTEVTDSEGNVWTLSGSAIVHREWVDVTSDTLERASVQISGRGRSNEASRADASTCALEIANRSGDYSPRNPLSSYYGILGRNTPLRVSVPAATSFLSLSDARFDYAFCRDSAALSVTGDLDVRADIDLPSWQGSPAVLPSQYYGLTQHAWGLVVQTTGQLGFVWSADGANDLSAVSTLPVPLPHHGRKSVRVTLDVDNGAAGNSVTFYTGTSLDGPWTQLGSAVTQAGVTSIFDSRAEVVAVGYGSSAYTGTGHARLYGLLILSGIGGTELSRLDLTTATAGARTLSDVQGNTWYLTGTAEISDRDTRYVGEVASWPTDWDTSGRDIWAPLDAGGIMRRLGQGSSPLGSTLYRGLTTSIPEIVAYWPCEDETAATSVSSALPGGLPMATSGVPDFAAFTDFACSKPLPKPGTAQLFGRVPGYYDPYLAHQVWFLLAVPEDGVASTSIVCRLTQTTSTACRWELSVNSAGDLRLQGFDNAVGAGFQIVDSGFVAFGVNGVLLRVSIGLDQNGEHVDWYLHTLEVGQVTGSAVVGTLQDHILGQIAGVEVNPDRTLGDTAIGHISVHKRIINLYDLYQELQAYSGERAAARVRRLCAEESIPVRIIGSVTDTVAMGFQTPATLLDLLHEASDADGGILYEPRDFLGLTLRTRASMHAQGELAGAALALDYSARHLSAFRPTDDDRYTRNDVTVQRQGGGSARAVEDDGRLGTKAAGRYDTSETLSVATDTALPDQASWRLHLGVADDARYTAVGMRLARSAFADTALAGQVRAVDVGDLLTVANPPALRGAPDTVRQLVQGLTETLGVNTHDIEVSTAPAAPWDVGIYNDIGSRYSAVGSYLTVAVTSGATSLAVATLTGPVWGTADLPYDIVVGGERMTVTAVSGSVSPQTFTVTRAVNGVVKAHLVNSTVGLFQPVFYAVGEPPVAVTSVLEPPPTPPVPPDTPPTPPPAPVPSAPAGRITRSGGALYRNGAQFKWAGVNVPHGSGCEAGGYLPTQAQFDRYFSELNPHSVTRYWMVPGMSLTHYDMAFNSAREYGQYLLVTLFNSLADCTNYRANSYGVPLNSTEQNWIRTVVSRHAGDSTVMGYECSNEAGETGAASSGAWYNAIGAAVKAIDPLALVGTGGGNNSNNSAAIQNWGDGPNVDMLSYHGYYPGTGNVDRGPSFQSAAAALNKVWYAGERGFCCGGGDTGSFSGNATKLEAEYDSYLAATNCCGYNYWEFTFISKSGTTGMWFGNGLWDKARTYDNSAWNGG